MTKENDIGNSSKLAVKTTPCPETTNKDQKPKKWQD
jgi:hypothetical protein